MRFESRFDSRREGGDKRFGADDKKKVVVRKKVCRFCADPRIILDYKEPRTLIPFATERGKVIPRRVTGICAFHQRRVGEAIQRARILALMPSGGSHMMPQHQDR